MPETKTIEFANSVDLDEVAHNDEPPHIDLHCLHSSLLILNVKTFIFSSFRKFADDNFVICVFDGLRLLKS